MHRWHSSGKIQDCLAWEQAGLVVCQRAATQTYCEASNTPAQTACRVYAESTDLVIKEDCRESNERNKQCHQVHECVDELACPPVERKYPVCHDT